MCEAVRLEFQHFETMRESTPELDDLTGAEVERFVRDPHSVAGVVQGEPVVLGGVQEIWKGRGNLWVIFSPKAAHNFIAVIRAMRRYLDAVPFDRVEMNTVVNSEHHRRAILMGFQLECPVARKYMPDGTDAAVYSRIKETPCPAHK